MSSTNSANLSTTTTASTSTASGGNYASYPSHKRQRVNEEGASVAKETTVKPTTEASNGAEGTSESAQKSTAAGYPNMALNLQKDPSWSTMLGDVDSFGGLGPIPSMNAVLEKRTSSQFSISSLLPSSMSMNGSATQSTAASASASGNAGSGRFENSTADNSAVTKTEHDSQTISIGTGSTTTNAATLPAIAEGSGGNTKYMDPSTGEYMYPENVKPMAFTDKQQLVERITVLPSQYLRGLMDVISKYQPDTVRQIDDDGYAFDLGQMNENTVWAISDYVKDSMIELDSYVKSLSSSGMGSSVSTDDQRQALAAAMGVNTLVASASSGSSGNVSVAQNVTTPTTPSTAVRQQTMSSVALSSAKISVIASNQSQNKFMEQVEMYSRPKVTKSRVKPSSKHECSICSKQFRGRSELKNHIRTHTGEKPLKCSYEGCNKCYAHSSNLRAHERTHAGVKPYACHYDGCGKSFAHSVSLKEHIWMHAGFQPYVCPYEGCEKKFTQVSNFARHKKTHEKDTHLERERATESTI